MSMVHIHQGLLDHLASRARWLPRAGWFALTVSAALVGAMSNATFCDAVGCRSASEWHVIFLGLALLGIGMAELRSVLDHQTAFQGRAAPMWRIRVGYWATLMSFACVAIGLMAFLATSITHLGLPGPATLTVSISVFE
jgi:hypothetical protein